MAGSTKLLTSGGGGVVLTPASNIASDVTVSIPSIAGNLAIDGPCFSAYQSAAQTITLNTPTKVAIDTVIFDTNSCFNTTTNRFTPSVAGYYQVNASIRGTVATTFTQYSLYFYKNGVTYSRGSALNATLTATNNSILSASTLIYMNGTTDYLELWGLLQGSGTATFSFSSTTDTSTFSASLMRAA